VETTAYCVLFTTLFLFTTDNVFHFKAKPEKLTNILRLNKNANYEIDVVGLDHHASDLISIPPLN